MFKHRFDIAQINDQSAVFNAASLMNSHAKSAIEIAINQIQEGIDVDNKINVEMLLYNAVNLLDDIHDLLGAYNKANPQPMA
jgi:hypothetical protein